MRLTPAGQNKALHFSKSSMRFRTALPSVAPSPVGASFFPGMEQTPYADTWGGAWTLSAGVVALGGKLGMPAVSDAMSSYTNWTLASGTRGTVQFGEFEITGAEQENLTGIALASGSGRYLIDYDFTSLPGGANTTVWIYEIAWGTANAQVRWGYHGQYVEFLSFHNSVQDGGGTGNHWAMGINYVSKTGALQMPLAGTFAIDYDATAQTAKGYFLDQGTNTFVLIDQATAVAFTGAPVPLVYVSPTGGNTKQHFSNFRSVRQPALTSGTATSPVYDTISPVREIWFPPALIGTGTAQVQYRTGATAAACQAAAWNNISAGVTKLNTTDTKVQLNVNFTVAAGQTSPEVGPFLVNGIGLGQTFHQQLFQHVAAKTLNLHVDVNHRFATDETASASLNFWGNPAQAIGAYLSSGGPASVTWRGTTYNLASVFVAGLNQSLTVDNASGGACLQESAEGLWGLVQGWNTIWTGGYLTGTMLDAWITNAIAALPSASGQGNFTVMAMLIQACCAWIYNATGGAHGHNYLDTDIDTWYTASQGFYRGNGLYDDGTAGAVHDDTYCYVFTWLYLLFLMIRPAYHNAATILSQVALTLAKSEQVQNENGQVEPGGRSHTSIRGMTVAVIGAMAAAQSVSGASFGKAAEQINRVFSEHFADGFWEQTAISSCSGSRDPGGWQTPPNNLAVGQLLYWHAFMGYHPSLSTLDTVAHVNPILDTPGTAVLWPEAVRGYVRGPGANDCLLHLVRGSYDTNGPTLTTEYNHRKLCEQFPAAYGNDANLIPVRAGWGQWFVDSVHGAQYCHALIKPAGSGVYRVGANKILTWAQGLTHLMGGGVNNMVADTGFTMAESILSDGHSVVDLAQIQAGANTVTEIHQDSMQVPLGTGQAVTNASTGTSNTYPYAYQQHPDGRSHIIAGIKTLGTALTNIIPTQGSATPNIWQNQNAASGSSVEINTNGVTLTGNIFAGTLSCYSKAAMTPATECARLTSLVQSTDWFTYSMDGDVRGQYAGTGTGKLNPAIGNYTLTGTIIGFSGTAAAAQRFGGPGLTALSYSATQLLACQTAGLINVDTVSIASTTRAWVTQACGDVTLFAACLPTGFSKVTAYDSVGVAHDVTSSCTITAGVSVVIPASVMSTYAASTAAEVTFDIQ